MPPFQALIDIFVELIDEIMPPLNEFIQSVLVPAFKLLADILKFLMPIIKFVAQVIGTVLTGAIKILTAILKPFIEIIKRVWEALAPLRRAMQILWNIIGQIAKQIWDKLMKAFKAIWDFIVKYIKPMWDNLMKAMEPLVNFIKDVFVNAIKSLMDFLKPLWDFIKPMIDGIMSLLGIKIDIKAAVKEVDQAEVDKAMEKATKKKEKVDLGGDFSDFTVGSGAGKEKVKNVTNINTKVDAKTDAKPEDIAANIVNAIKFNLPVGMAGGTGILPTNAGSQFGTAGA